jgi:hypothetical protein
MASLGLRGVDCKESVSVAKLRWLVVLRALLDVDQMERVGALDGDLG